MHDRSRIYKDKFYTFDIETTTIITGFDEEKNPIRNGIIWSGQFYDGIEYTQVRDLLSVIDKLKAIEEEAKDLGTGEKILVFIHNENYEFQFIKNFFKWTKILATSPHRIIAAETEFMILRCSYALSNQSLDKFLKNENVPEEYRKTNMDYLVERYPWTEITEDEYIYCKNDVVGLHLAIENRINQCFNKDVNFLPLTSTGYVRKACRTAINESKQAKARFRREKLDIDTFNKLQFAFRGGNTHANRYYVNKPLTPKGGIGQKDEASAYPAALLYFDYPTKFFDLKPFKRAEFDYYMQNTDKWALLIEVAIKDIHLKNPEATPVPYISISKCDPITFHSSIRKEKAEEVDNGRVLSCAYLRTVCTEIDYLIIKTQYDWNPEDEKIISVKVARKKPIPEELKKQILHFYYNKTSLKQDELDPNFDKDKEYNYKRSKEMVNGIYGMHVSSPIRPDYLINNLNETLILEDGTEVPPHAIYQDISLSDEELLEKYYNSYSSFLSYQVGIWVTSYSRMMLEEGIRACERTLPDGKVVNDLVYCDTDSCKFLNPELHEEAFKAINEARIKLAEKRGAYVDYNGKRYYLGIFDNEPTAISFKTFGAKKYMYSYINKDGKEDFKITISGVPKAAGKACIEEAIKKGKIKSFLDVKKGFVFHGIKTTSCYMDYDTLNSYEIDGKNVYYSSNIAMYPSSYTLGLTYEFEILLDKFKDYMEV